MAPDLVLVPPNEGWWWAALRVAPAGRYALLIGDAQAPRHDVIIVGDLPSIADRLACLSTELAGIAFGGGTAPGHRGAVHRATANETHPRGNIELARACRHT